MELEAQIQRVYPVAINIMGLGWFLFSLAGFAVESFLPEGIGEWVGGTAEMPFALHFCAWAYQFWSGSCSAQGVADSTNAGPLEQAML